MKYRDVSVNSDTAYITGNKFCIQLDVSLLLEQIKKKSMVNQESLQVIEGRLFSYFQNLKCKKDILDEFNERAVHIQGHDNSAYLTFKLNYSKHVKLNDHTKLALFLSMMPQFLTGDEFSFFEPENDKMVKSPRAQLCGIVTHKEEQYFTYVDIEGCWTCFSDEYLRQLNFYENVIEKILTDVQTPFILIYKVCPSPIQRPNVQVREMLNEYLGLVLTKRLKNGKKAISTFGDKEPKEETKGEIEFENENDTLSENQDAQKLGKGIDHYKRGAAKRSIASEDKPKKKKPSAINKM
mmetsp:Transcript_17222/g.19926  ORF Transcript_17222/g.19926 Transcript_17222/m.19926 type:complete len:295 (+) Transcript_17222:575-1459(+)